MKAGNYAQALKIYEESIVQYPEASLLWAEKGRCLYSLSIRDRLSPHTA